MSEQPKLINVNITGSEELITPAEIKSLIPAPQKSLDTVLESRVTLQKILDDQDDRCFMIVGPCSIHDPKAALEYAHRLKKLSDQVKEKIYIVMRVYFEKPRTTIGWKGLINDPHLDDSFHIEEGLKIARKLLCEITAMGLATATEALDPLTPQYLAELISWAAIGARTTESQTHREMASGLSMPVGIKNGTDGSIQTAIDALNSVKKPHHFLGINQDGQSAKFSTSGNPYAHIVLRGGGGRPNYDRASISVCEAALVKNHLRKKIVVDCSHANSNKDHGNQVLVLKNCVEQILDGNDSIVGFMIESNLNAGNQAIPADLSQLKYGVSITDKCVDWDTTEAMLLEAFQKL